MHHPPTPSPAGLPASAYQHLVDRAYRRRATRTQRRSYRHPHNRKAVTLRQLASDLRGQEV